MDMTHEMIEKRMPEVDKFLQSGELHDLENALAMVSKFRDYMNMVEYLVYDKFNPYCRCNHKNYMISRCFAIIDAYLTEALNLMDDPQKAARVSRIAGKIDEAKKLYR
jgi:hypothetical protein